MSKWSSIITMLSFLSIFGGASAQSLGPDDLTADAALAMANKGEIIIIDVRTPEEWKQTGVPENAKAIALNNPAFLNVLNEAINNDKTKPIALICRTGNRSGHAQKQLAGMGFTNVKNIKEGMAGSSGGPGWLKRGLPLRQP